MDAFSNAMQAEIIVFNLSLGGLDYENFLSSEKLATSGIGVMSATVNDWSL